MVAVMVAVMVAAAAAVAMTVMMAVVAFVAYSAVLCCSMAAFTWRGAGVVVLGMRFSPVLGDGGLA
eukprot:492047-Pleurochrysis_carterae.AAC.1